MLAVRRSRQRRWLALAGALVMLMTLAACTSDDEAAPVRTTVDKVWTAAGIDPVSAVRNVGGVAVVYGITPEGLMIYGLDPATGTQLWSRSATLPVNVDEVSVTSVGNWVTYLRPIGSDRISQLVVADPTTGDDHSISAPRHWNTTGSACLDGEGAVCLNSYLQLQDGDWGRQVFRVDVDSGETTPEERPEFDGGQPLGSADLFFDRVDDDPVLTRRSGGELIWSRTFTELFGSEFKFLGSYNNHESADNLYSVLSMLSSTTNSAAEEYDLATDTVTAAFLLSDGSSKWIDTGSYINCYGNHPLLRWASSDDSSPDKVFRCRYTGTAVRTIAALNGTENVTSNLNVVLESVDSDSGSVNWSADLGDARTLAADATLGRDESVLDDEHLFVPNSQGGLIVDIINGEIRPPADTDRFWCEDNRAYARPEPYFTDDTKPVTTAQRYGVYRTCHADGTDAAAPTSSIPDEVSTSFGQESRVAAVNGAVSGYLVPPDVSTSHPTSMASPETTAVSDPASTSAAPPPPVTGPELAWQTTGYEPLTDVRLVGGTAVLYATINSDLLLIGLDPATGVERWRQPASAAGMGPTAKLSVTDIDGSVSYFRPTTAANERTHLVLADPVSGADRWVTEEHWWTGLPQICERDSPFLCANSYEPNDGEALTSTPMHIDKSSGSVSVAPPTDGPYDEYFGDVVGVRGAPTETIGVLQDGVLLWSAPVRDLIGGERSTDVLSITGLRPGNPPIVYISSTVNWLLDQTTGYPALDLAANLTTVAVNYQTGAVLWRESGTSTNCRMLLGDIQKMSTPGSVYPALRCRYTGTLNSTPPGSGHELTSATNLSVTIERVDLQTGKAIWSIPVGEARSLAADNSGIAMIQLDDHRILINGEVLDLDAGSVRPPTPDETFWCPARQAFRQGVVAYQRGLPRFDRAAGGEVYQCDANTNPVSTTPTDVPLAVSTMTADGLRLVSTPAGVIAYRVPL